jgi:hypothetical protein
VARLGSRRFRPALDLIGAAPARRDAKAANRSQAWADHSSSVAEPRAQCNEYPGRSRPVRAFGSAAQRNNDGFADGYLRGNCVAFNQFINAGAKLKLEPKSAQRFVITGRASGTVIEATVAGGQALTITANSESLRVDSFEPEPEVDDMGAIPFQMTGL